MPTRLNSDRRLIEDENQYRDELAGYVLEAAYAGNTRGRQTALRHNKPRQRSCRGVHSEHYVFDTKLRAFGGLRENREEALGFPPSFCLTVLR